MMNKNKLLLSMRVWNIQRNINRKLFWNFNQFCTANRNNKKCLYLYDVIQNEMLSNLIFRTTTNFKMSSLTVDIRRFHIDAKKNIRLDLNTPRLLLISSRNWKAWSYFLYGSKFNILAATENRLWKRKYICSWIEIIYYCKMCW